MAGETEQLNYATPPLPRAASARRMFWFLLPGAACIATIITTMMIEIAFPNAQTSLRAEFDPR